MARTVLPPRAGLHHPAPLQEPVHDKRFMIRFITVFTGTVVIINVIGNAITGGCS